MDSTTRATLEEVETLLEGFKSTGGAGSTPKTKEVLLKKTLGLDTAHIEGMIQGAKILEIGNVKYVERTKNGGRVSYPLKFEKDGVSHFGSLRVSFDASLKDGIELTFVVVDKGAWKEKSERPEKTPGKKMTPLQAKLKSIGYGKKQG